ncbi:MAG: hypothetical protein GEU99_05505 [Luteitalea sp.]|nr:hypothetical protein [Luteitalea sp.]
MAHALPARHLLSPRNHHENNRLGARQRPSLRARRRARPATFSVRVGVCVLLFFLPAPPRPLAQQRATNDQALRVGRFRLSGYGQFDARLLQDADTEEPADPLSIRRIFIIFAGDIIPQVGFVLQGDLTDKRILRDAYVNFKHFPAAEVRIGQFVAPFSLERLTGTSRLEAIDRTDIGTRLSPSRDIGIMVANSTPFWDWLSYGAAVVNGTGRNTSDNNDPKDLVGRLSATVPAWRGFSIGVNGAIGDQPEGRRSRVGADMAYDQPLYRVAAEVVREAHGSIVAADERVNVSRGGPFARRGFYLLGVWKVAGGIVEIDAEGNVTLPDRRLELVARYVDLDDPTGELSTREIQTGANYYLSPTVRVMLQGSLQTKDSPVIAGDTIEIPGHRLVLRAQISF